MYTLVISTGSFFPVCKLLKELSAELVTSHLKLTKNLSLMNRPPWLGRHDLAATVFTFELISTEA